MIVVINEAEINQANLLTNWKKFREKLRPRTKKDRDKKRHTFEIVNAL